MISWEAGYRICRSDVLSIDSLVVGAATAACFVHKRCLRSAAATGYWCTLAEALGNTQLATE